MTTQPPFDVYRGSPRVDVAEEFNAPLNPARWWTLGPATNTDTYGSTDPHCLHRYAENKVEVRDGNLWITATRDPSLSFADGTGWRSGFITTRKHGSQPGWAWPLYGEIRFRALLPRQLGMWAALWLRHWNGGADRAEVDLVETFSAGRDAASLHLHFPKSTGTNVWGRGRSAADLDMGTFHEYWVRVEPAGSGVKFTLGIDDWVAGSYTHPDRSHLEEGTNGGRDGWDLAICMAVSGSAPTGNPAHTASPQVMRVDWVRHTPLDAPPVDQPPVDQPPVEQPPAGWKTGVGDRHVAVWVDGVDVTCNTLVSLQIKGGRSDRWGQPDASTCAFQILLDETAFLPDMGTPVAVAGWLPGREDDTRMALFSGHVTDLALEGDVLSVLAVDPSRHLAGTLVGDRPWPIEPWSERMQRIWNAAKTAAAPWDPAWMRDGSYLWNQFSFPPFNRWMWGRDVDRQPAKQLLEDTARPVQTETFYIPHTAGLGAGGSEYPQVCPAHPTQWTPAPGIRSGLDPNTGWSHARNPVYPALPKAPACLIAQYPRQWRNLSGLMNEIKVIVEDERLTGNGQQTERFNVEYVDIEGPSRRIHGLRQTTVSTSFADKYLGHATGTGQWLAHEWLARTGWPVWGLDNLRVMFIRPLYTQHYFQNQINDWFTWMLDRGPGQIGRLIDVETIPGRPSEQWAVEGTSITWDPEGWIFDLSCSDPRTYSGDVARSAPETMVTVDDPPAEAGAAGAMLSVRVTRRYGGRPVTWGSITAGGITTPINGVVTAVPTGALAAGQNDLVVAFVPPAGATDLAGSQTTIRITGNTSWVTWAALKPAPTWANVPAATTWATATRVESVTP